jgi:putative membrane-bound dehydrogenase-like protein
MVFLGGEVVVDYAIRFKMDFDASRLWITAYANDVSSYIPSRRVLREGGYEADDSMWLYARPNRFNKDTEDLISDSVMKLLPRWFYPAVKQADLPPPKDIVDALASIKVAPGFRVELVAAEPLVEDPVAFDWGPDGRLWVVEMRDYPNGLTWNGPGDPKNVPGGRVKVLRDTDGDGRYDQATVFLDDLPFPNGVKAWRGGVLITAAPSVLYAEDHDGDDKADKRVVVYEGFTEGNQQHRANGLRWGIDNWLYMANGDSGGAIKSIATGDLLAISGRDLRVRPDTGGLDAQAGQTQFGRCRTDWGDWFGGNNANPMWHYVLEDHYMRRNPHVAPPENRKHVSVKPGASPVFPLSKTLARFNDFNMSNRFTSACSPEIYRDDWRPGGPAVETHVFICEPVHNLVHHEVMTANGATFTSRRAADEQQSEFFASSDNWCRPVMVRSGPDGAIWIADMYRAVIEHPEWIPHSWQRKLDLRAGSNRGRIYRVVADRDAMSARVDHKPAASIELATAARDIPKLDRADIPGVVAALDSANGWQRDMAQQMIVELLGPAPKPPLATALRADGTILVDEAARQKAIELLKAMARRNARPLARLHALCALDGIGALRADLVLAALEDSHAGVRRHAARLAETFLSDPESSTVVGEALVKAGADSEPAVRIQVAYSLGAWDERGGAPLARLAMRHLQDPYLVAAVLSSVHRGNLRLALTTVFVDSPASPPAQLVDPLLATATGWNDRALLDETLAVIAKPASVASEGQRYATWQLLALGGCLEVVERRKLPLESQLSPTTRQLMDALMVEARVTANDPNALDQRRIAAVRLMGRATPEASQGATAGAADASTGGAISKSPEVTSKAAKSELSPAMRRDIECLVGLLTARNSPELQTAAIQTLARIRSPEIASRCLDGWKSHSPAVRTQLMDMLMSREEGAKALLASLADGRVLPSQIDARRRQQLLTHRAAEVRYAAGKAFEGAGEPSRRKVLEAYRAALTMAGDGVRGKAVFGKRCATCHRLDGQGHNVGPDIASLGNKSPESLLVAMLDPNRAIEDRYLDFVVEMIEGRSITGLLGSESSTSVTLLAPEAKSTIVLRNQIEEMRSTGKSLMPEGLERELSTQDCADVIAYIRHAGLPPKRFAGNKPATVTADETGAIRLLATTARIYGPNLVYEETYRNLGYWTSDEDRATWSLVVPKAGRYRVTLDYACANDVAGERFEIQVAGQLLAGESQGTGGWENYSGKSIGMLDLPAGAAELVMRSAGPIKAALLDLRGIRLTPVQ